MLSVSTAGKTVFGDIDSQTTLSNISHDNYMFAKHFFLSLSLKLFSLSTFSFKNPESKLAHVQITQVQDLTLFTAGSDSWS